MHFGLFEKIRRPLTVLLKFLSSNLKVSILSTRHCRRRLVESSTRHCVRGIEQLRLVSSHHYHPASLKTLHAQNYKFRLRTLLSYLTLTYYPGGIMMGTSIEGTTRRLTELLPTTNFTDGLLWWQAQPTAGTCLYYITAKRFSGPASHRSRDF